MWPPASLIRTCLHVVQTASRPRLSYAPPSVNTTRVVNGALPTLESCPLVSVPAGNENRAGERKGGKAEDAATTAASSTSGFACEPTRQSPSTSFEKRQRSPDWRLVASNTNSGLSGRWLSVALPKS